MSENSFRPEVKHLLVASVIMMYQDKENSECRYKNTSWFRRWMRKSIVERGTTQNTK